MELFTDEIIERLTAQYDKGNFLSLQEVVCKIYNPYGLGIWYCINMDPSDKDYIWCIAHLYEWEIGSITRSELESITMDEHGMELKRDLDWKPINAQDCWVRVANGETL
ncbi:MAG: DUF2958 domain-containing protein [Bacteroidota bacterium]